MLKGIKASEGIAIGYAKLLIEADLSYEEMSVLTIEEEKKRYIDAKTKGVNRLEALKQHTLETIGEHEAEVFEAHKQLLLDPVMEKDILSCIENLQTTEFAYVEIIDRYIKLFEQMDNAYMRERALDLKDIKMNQLRILCGVEVEDEKMTEDAILVTFDLTPSETVKIDRQHTKGFVTEIGGETSHSAIIARTLGIPAVVGVGKELNTIQNGDLLILDGLKGEVHINPDENQIESFRAIQEKLAQEKSAVAKYKHEASVTRDGKAIEIACNIAGVDDVEYVLEATADGIGLFRSEFLYMNREALPTEEEQYLAYKEVLSRMAPKPVTIRTMDIGGDKEVGYLDLEREMNPFLGYRAIRICLEDQKLFKTQLRALLRASLHGSLRIMFPMISSLEELLAAKAIVSEVAREVDHGTYELGIMIEIPAAALIADILAEEVDFFSIGTNDLIQYTTAVDRMNAKVSNLYTPYHPAFIRLINNVIKAGHEANIEVGMCGNVAGYADFIPLLLDMGLDEFSMSPDMILKARAIVNNHQVDPQKPQNILQLKTAEAFQAALKKN